MGSEPQPPTQAPQHARAFTGSSGRAAARTSRSATLAQPHGELAAEYDAVIVGSGYGGAIAAAHLAGTRRVDGERVRVCLMERGKEHPVGTFPETLLGALGQSQVSVGAQHHGASDALFWLHAGEVSVLHGCGLGGTSLINAGVALAPDPRIWEDPLWPSALVRDVDRGLASSFARVSRNLGVTTHPAPERLDKHLALGQSARALRGDARVRPTPLSITFDAPASGHNAHGVAQRACNDCGNCVSGCNVGAKNTLAMNYLPAARDAGAQIFCELSVHHVEVMPDGQYAVFYEPLHRQRARFDGPLPFVRARVVILSAGVMGTTEILLRSKRAGLRCSERVGQRVSGNGDMLGFAHGTQQPVNGVGQTKSAAQAGPGPSITGVVDQRDQPTLAQGYVLQEGAIPAALAALATRWVQAAAIVADGDTSAPRHVIASMRRLWSERRVRPATHTQTLLLMSHDAADGVVELQGDRAQLRLPQAADDHAPRALHAALSRASAALGGRYVAAPFARQRHGPITVHPLGGAVMAEDASGGVTDHSGRLFSSAQGTGTHAGLYVCDASLLPRSLGVNPLLTISALADRNVRLIAAQQGWLPARTPSTAALTHTEAPGALRFRFTEKLVGHLDRRWGADEAPLAIEARGDATTRAELVLTIGTQDCLAMVNDPVHRASISGTALIPCLSAHPMAVSDGVFNMFVDAIGEPRDKRMRYRMRLTARDGSRYWFDGHKDISQSTGRGLWADTTILFTEVFADGDDVAPIARGVLRVTAPNFARELTSMRGTDHRGRPSWRALWRYGWAFGAGLAQVYAPRVLRTQRRRDVQPERAVLPTVLTEHGRTSLAYSSVADPAVHTHASEHGAALYGRIRTLLGARTLICGDPLCAPERQAALLRELSTTYPDAGFFQVTSTTADQLRALGYEVTQLGIETSVHLPSFSLRGRAFQNLRTAYNRARREGVMLVEGRCADMGAERMMRISRDWMRHKTITRGEIAFFARPVVYADEPHVRKFFALRDGKMLAYVCLDPMFERGRPFGYVANILRHDPLAPRGVCDALLVHAARALRDEGMRELNLGMSPFFRPDHVRGGDEPWMANALVDLNYRWLNALFHYRGIAFHKRRWRAQERPVFYAGRPGAALIDFYAAARMTGVL